MSAKSSRCLPHQLFAACGLSNLREQASEHADDVSVPRRGVVGLLCSRNGIGHGALCLQRLDQNQPSREIVPIDIG